MKRTVDINQAKDEGTTPKTEVQQLTGIHSRLESTTKSISVKCNVVRTSLDRISRRLDINPLHKWRLNLNNNTHTSLASHSCRNSFVLKHECEAKDVPSIAIQI